MWATLPLCLVPLQWTFLRQIHATATTVFSPDDTITRYGSSLVYARLPHMNEHLCDQLFIIALPRNYCVNISTSHHNAIKHKHTSYSRIHKSAFWGGKASFQPCFVFAHAQVLSILHHWKWKFCVIQVILPTSLLNATVRAAFIPDSTLEFLPIFNSSKCTKSSVFSGFLHPSQ